MPKHELQINTLNAITIKHSSQRPQQPKQQQKRLKQQQQQDQQKQQEQRNANSCCWWCWWCCGPTLNCMYITLTAFIIIMAFDSNIPPSSGASTEFNQNMRNSSSTNGVDGRLDCNLNTWNFHEPSNGFGVGKRAKRFLTFSGGGVVKFVFGITLPVKLVERHRTLSMFYNIHVQYPPPPRPLYWWSLWNTTTFAARQYQEQHHQHQLTVTTETEVALQRDVSREWLYGFIETWLTRADAVGAVCLLQAICNVSQKPFNEASDEWGLFSALLNAILIPTQARVSTKYWQAHLSGRHGADCRRTYSACPIALNWLRRFSYLL